ncbi:DUF924 family protein [Leisingera methylohalidivorans]|uniref:DUF924 domain-containing protein n=1 Tax=Leisingera methylohalidivorans DSM 14336 TaxID=999552 RepID=V9VVB5_9RHOB|nr:DUF924 family protein [Leisingera methylohalidivorans]AHD00827.1 hypothetical protein METH_09170 [Leisingera methylohalidivorans DSM 14336]
MTGPEEILAFWLDKVGEKGWYLQDDALDQEIRTKFQKTWEAACEGRFSLWLTYPSGTLAYILLMDQFPRNMFRGEGKAFASDRAALSAAKVAINKNWDKKIDEPARQFFYLPLMHSENLCDQERCIRLMLERMPRTGTSNLLHARAHREVIRQFGRFPYRNEALRRASTAPELDYVMAGGYRETVRRVQAAG